MKKMYANLLGEWTLLNDEPTLRIDNSYTDVYMWIEEQLQDLDKYSYVNISYKNRNYRIHPCMIQIVTE
ncbi:TPA: hypothetical protein ACHBIR_001888 [Enterococcus faecium]|uniref:hypothetical protein n=2 Tax=Enterococcus TaxID=1350 RepID=UPI0001CEACB6|nr:hypothetical protein [Enterococcus faecium]EFF36655.1 conserved hypothetical protein [Enterococcus faecium E980]MDP8584518.1 hypothetical protein [Listeria innocua]HCB27652.1 hypothetical protein [Enterococcus sp.]EGP5288160.1 hypothetical protein [Enterococcus faecium]MCL6148413.1 hypothetical protein [Enterococcus faecium]